LRPVRPCGLELLFHVYPPAPDVLAHLLLGRDRVAACNRSDDFLVIIEGFHPAVARVTGSVPVPVAPDQVREIFEQHLRKPLVSTSPGDEQVEIEVQIKVGFLVVSLARRYALLLAMLVEQLLERRDLGIVHILGGQRASHALERLLNLEDLAQVVDGQGSHAHPYVWSALQELASLEPANRFTQRYGENGDVIQGYSSHVLVVTLDKEGAFKKATWKTLGAQMLDTSLYFRTPSDVFGSYSASGSTVPAEKVPAPVLDEMSSGMCP